MLNVIPYFFECSAILKNCGSFHNSFLDDSHSGFLDCLESQYQGNSACLSVGDDWCVCGMVRYASRSRHRVDVQEMSRVFKAVDLKNNFLFEKSEKLWRIQQLAILNISLTNRRDKSFFIITNQSINIDERLCQKARIARNQIGNCRFFFNRFHSLFSSLFQNFTWIK